MASFRIFHHSEHNRSDVAVEDTPQKRAFFVSLKERLKERFQQHDIWSHLIDVV